jgi:multidrug transporter EmrE-like cation transporter
MVYFLLFLALTFNAVANICIKLGSKQVVLDLQHLLAQPLMFIQNGYLVVGLCFFAAALVLYSLVLSQMSLSMAYPIMTGAGFVLVVGFSIFVLREQLFWWQWLGIAFILFGVVLLSQGSLTS